MAESVNQDALDYSNEAHMRVCVRTDALEKVTTLTTSPGVQEYALPDDVYDVLEVADAATLIGALTTQQALALLSYPDAASQDAAQHYVIGGNIGFIPTPTDQTTYTLYYRARPAPLASDSPFEVSGDYETLVEHQTLAYTLDDDGQVELALAEQGFCDAEYVLLQNRPRRAQRVRPAAAGFDSAI